MKTMKFLTCLLPFLLAAPIMAQTPSQTPAQPADPWQSLSFLQGSWEARTGAGSSAKVVGVYTFAKELKGHILSLHGVVADCTGPDSFDCQHSDLLYLYLDAPGQPLKAIYFDNEGHVIHYGISLPDPMTIVFLSEPGPGPRYRLTYHRDGSMMFGKFQMQPPGQDTWTSYLEWSGAKQ
jgi:hypothetical protein